MAKRRNVGLVLNVFGKPAHAEDIGVEPRGPADDRPARIVDMSDHELWNAVASTCLLCGKALRRRKQDTNEDVFPLWLQELFDITDEDLGLIGGEHFVKYKDLLVPACQRCNTRDMSIVENRISRAVKQGFDEFSRLSYSDVLLWAAKIFYGLLHFEVRPRHKKTKKRLPPTQPVDVIRMARFLLLLLQGFRKRVNVIGPEKPASILRFRLKHGGPRKLNFDFKDSTVWPQMLSMRMGDIGLIAVFDDGGAFEDYWLRSYAETVGDHALHPLQFGEITARALYFGLQKALCFNYNLLEGRDELALLLTRPTVEDGVAPDEQRLATLLNECTGLSLFDADAGRCRTLLCRSEGQFNDMEFTPGEYPLGITVPIGKNTR